MSLNKLPSFEGNIPESTTGAFTGTLKDEGKKPDRAFRLDEQAILVVRVTTKDVTHSTKDGVVTRKHKWAVLEAHEAGSAEANELLADVDVPISAA